MPIELLNESIKVRADFTAGVITPLAFKRNGKTHRVSRVNARWIDRERESRRFFFSVSAEGNIFEIHLDAASMSWRLDRVYLDG